MSNLFSIAADDYARFRPHYPDSLYQCIYRYCKDFSVAADIGCGSGQATATLGLKFKKVYGIDSISEPLLHAPKAEHIQYIQSPAEQIPLEDHSLTLITVAQAFHWFSFENFFSEVRRCLKPGGLLAIWTYGRLHFENKKDDESFREFYYGPFHTHWPSERQFVDRQYKNILFPKSYFYAPLFKHSFLINKNHLEGYFKTWSAYKNFQFIHPDVNPFEKFISNLNREACQVYFPIQLYLFSF